MIDYELKQFTENELMELLDNSDDLMILVFCDLHFSLMSFYPLYGIYDDVTIYVMKRTNKNMDNLKYIPMYDDKIENMNEYTCHETDDFINEYFERVLFKMYFGHS